MLSKSYKDLLRVAQRQQVIRALLNSTSNVTQSVSGAP